MKRPRLISPHFGGYLFGIAYQNADKTIPHQNPIRLNAKGAVLLYGADIQEVRDINNTIVDLPLDDGYCYFVDKYGKPLVNGKVYTYFYQSTVPKESFDNNGQLNTNPIILDDDGKAQINMDGNYRLRIYDKDGVCMGDDDFFGEHEVIKLLVLASALYPYASDEQYHIYTAIVNLELYDKVIVKSFEETIYPKAVIANLVLKDTVFDYQDKFPDAYISNANILQLTLKDKVIPYHDKFPDAYISNADIVHLTLINKIIVHHQPSDKDTAYAVQGANIIHLTLKDR